MAYLEIKNITKIFEGRKVLDNVSLNVEEGKLHTLFGPSGCGKSTLLRILSGLHELDGGNIFLNGKEISNLPPQKRGITMVFQQFSLFPNMNVLENITYGLKIRGIKKNIREEKGRELLRLINLSGFENREITELSGGEKQRVAIARALAPNPDIILMDEPLSALDARLRESLRKEITRIHRDTNKTIIFVTHDMEEAMEISDGISVMNNGKIVESGTPEEIYLSLDPFTERFLGRNNIINGSKLKSTFDSSKDYVVRPERITLDSNGDYEGIVENITFLGDRVRFGVTFKGQVIEILTLNQGENSFNKGDKIRFNIKESDLKERQ